MWAEVGTEHYEAIKTELNREIGKRIEHSTGKRVDFIYPDVVAIVDTAYDHVSLEVHPLYIYGRYRKFVRNIPQTKWPCWRCGGRGCSHCDGRGSMYDESVEELIASATLAHSQGKGEKFHGMGREDIDVRMLGNGRPFVLEILEPKRRGLDYVALAAEINANARGKVEVIDLRPSSKEEMRRIKHLRPKKTYSALVKLERAVPEEQLQRAVTTLSNCTVAQQTPTRVVHRRADLTRKRRILKMEIIDIAGNKLRLRITAEAGTYIKELIHGDGGRTQPNLAEVLGVPCSVEELDVIKIWDTE